MYIHRNAWLYAWALRSHAVYSQLFHPLLRADILKLLLPYYREIRGTVLPVPSAAETSIPVALQFFWLSQNATCRSALGWLPLQVVSGQLSVPAISGCPSFLKRKHECQEGGEEGWPGAEWGGHGGRRGMDQLRLGNRKGEGLAKVVSAESKHPSQAWSAFIGPQRRITVHLEQQVM